MTPEESNQVAEEMVASIQRKIVVLTQVFPEDDHASSREALCTVIAFGVLWAGFVEVLRAKHSPRVLAEILFAVKTISARMDVTGDGLAAAVKKSGASA